jgi:site-specific DNA-methyltransferase (adenine-specific)
MTVAPTLAELDARVRWRWITETCGVPRSTAGLCMQLAQHRARIEAEIKRVGRPVSIREARRLIAKPRAKTKPGSKPDSQLSKVLRLMVERINAPGASDHETLNAARQVAAILTAKGFGSDTNITIAITARNDSSCTPLVWFDPQYRGVLDYLDYANEGERQCERAELPAMSEEYVDAVLRESARVLWPGGYVLLWADAFNVLESHHKRIEDVLKTVSLCAWDNQRLGQGYRFRNRGSYLIALQKPLQKPLRWPAKSTWRDHGIPDRWSEKVSRKLHPHSKPVQRLIGALTEPGDLVIDPAAGSYTVWGAARRYFSACAVFSL